MRTKNPNTVEPIFSIYIQIISIHLELIKKKHNNRGMDINKWVLINVN